MQNAVFVKLVQTWECALIVVSSFATGNRKCRMSSSHNRRQIMICLYMTFPCSLGHLSGHLLTNPAHCQLYSYKLKCLVCFNLLFYWTYNRWFPCFLKEYVNSYMILDLLFGILKCWLPSYSRWNVANPLVTWPIFASYCVATSALTRHLTSITACTQPPGKYFSLSHPLSLIVIITLW